MELNLRILNLQHCRFWIGFVLIMSLIGCSSSVKVTTSGRSSPAKSGAISLTEITLTASNSSPSVSDTFTITAKGVYSDASTKDLTNDATWSVSSSVIELGTTKGSATASSEGDATITATYGEVSGTVTISVGAAALKSLFILPGTGANRVGVKQSMTAIGVFASGTVSDITSTSTWSSSNTSVATIDSSVNIGQATLLATGSTTITASRGGISATRVLTVDTPTLTSLAVAPTTLLLANGYTAAASVVGTYSDSQKLDLTSSATWSSSNTAVATVSNSFGSKGLVTGVSAGSSTLTAGVLSLSGTGVVNVTSATLSSIAINPSSLTIASGTKEQLKADGLFSDASSLDLTYSATWDSTNAAVSVNNTGLSKGIITGENDGSSNVRATQNSVTGSASVIVSTATLVSIAVTPLSPSITSTGHIQLKATGTFSDSSTQDITKVATWRSSDLAIAIVGSSDGFSAGLVAGNADGTATITASFGDKSGNTTVTVASGAARALSSIVVTPSSTVLSIGSTAQFTATGVYNDNTTTDITATSTWSVGDAAVLQDNTLGSITTLASGTTSVSATKDSLTGSAQVTVTVDQVAPPTPTGLTASVVSSAQLNFSWTSGGGTTASYRYAYQAGAGAPASCSAGTTGTTSSTSVSITGLTANTAYTMIVCALNADSTPDSSAATAGVTGTTSGPSLLAYSGTSFSESSTNLGAITATRTITVTNDTFVAGGTYTSGVEYSVSGVPAGLTLVVTRTSATVLTLSFTGNAASHANANDTSSVSLTLNAAAFTSGVASTNNNPQSLSIDFNDASTLTYSGTSFAESSTNLGAITATRTITLANDTFVAGGTYTSGSEYTVSGVPAGLTLVVTRTSATVLTLSFTGNAGSHANSNDTSSVSLTLNAAAFTSTTASASNNPQSLSIDFSDPSTLTYSGTSFAEAAANDGSITATRTITLANDTFVAGGTYTANTEYSVTGVPAGLTFVVTRTSATVLTLSFSGNAASHANANDTSSISLTLNAAAFTSTTASASNNPQSLSIDFIDPAPGAFAIAGATNGNTESVVTWGASTGAASYTVSYGTSTGSYGTTFSTNATSPTTITGLTNGTTYYIMVTAVNTSGCTNATAEATATPAGLSATVYNSGSGTFTVPGGVTSVIVEAWGGGGGGGAGSAGSHDGGHGGGGGAYCKKTLTVSPGDTIAYSVGAGGTIGTMNSGTVNGGNGGNSTATYSAVTYTAGGGTGGASDTNGDPVTGFGGTASGCDENRTGGSGAATTGSDGGGGGSSAASGSAGATSTLSITGATAPSGGGNGGNGGSQTFVGNPGSAPGGGGGGGGKTDMDGGVGGAGRVKFSW